MRAGAGRLAVKGPAVGDEGDDQEEGPSVFCGVGDVDDERDGNTV